MRAVLQRHKDMEAEMDTEARQSIITKRMGRPHQSVQGCNQTGNMGVDTRKKDQGNSKRQKLGATDPAQETKAGRGKRSLNDDVTGEWDVESSDISTMGSELGTKFRMSI
ncbi:hypothetical protein Mapa_016690 [Marchantia paleacea]|nr:hypothetical protein Mapa_016690 [Marchantia paleacea]